MIRNKSNTFASSPLLIVVLFSSISFFSAFFLLPLSLFSFFPFCLSLCSILPSSLHPCLICFGPSTTTSFLLLPFFLCLFFCLSFGFHVVWLIDACRLTSSLFFSHLSPFLLLFYSFFSLLCGFRLRSLLFSSPCLGLLSEWIGFCFSFPMDQTMGL